MRKTTQLLSENLLVLITICFSAGIIFSRQIRYSDNELVFLHPLLLLLLLLTLLLCFSKKNELLVWLVLFISGGIGFHHNHSIMQSPDSPSHIFNQVTDKTEIVLVGTLLRMVTFNGRNSRVIVEAESIRFEFSDQLLPTHGKVSLSFKGNWPKQYIPGDKLVIRCSAKRPTSFNTPHSFDYAQYLATQHIWITGFVRSHMFIHKLDQAPGIYHRLYFLPERLRTKLGEQIDNSLEKDAAAMYRAVLLGDRSPLDKAILESFKGSGTMHILAISGLHMAVIGTLLFTTLYWLLSRSEYLLLRCTVQKWAAFICMPFLIGYSLLTGMNAPVMRAVIMSCIIIAAIVTNRKNTPAALVALAALVILVSNPLQLYTVSFQLSFSAIISILFILPTVKLLVGQAPDSTHQKVSVLQKCTHWLLAGFIVSVTATLGTAPLLLSNFNRVSIIGPVANLIIEPLICMWSLPLGFISILITSLSPEMSSFLLHIGSYGLTLASSSANFFSSLPYSSIWLPSPPLWVVVLYYVALIILATQSTKRLWFMRASLVFLAVSILLMVSQDRIIRKKPSTFQLTFLDVGQGNSTLMEYPTGERVLVDGGGSSYGSQSVGEQVIAPFLWKNGIGKIDAIVITHPDADHYNGLSFLVKHFSPTFIWVSDTKGHDDNFKDLIELSQKHSVQLIIPERGQRMDLSGVDFQCVANLISSRQNDPRQQQGSLRNLGIILRAGTASLKALFPGDIGVASEQELIEEGYDIQADILQSPHHGSKTSNSIEFLEAVSPKFLIVSAGHYGKGYFPHPGLEEDCRSRNITMLTTASEGTITIKSEDKRYKVFRTGRYDDNIFFPLEPILVPHPSRGH